MADLPANGAASSALQAATEFRHFPRFPPEIQHRIFTEAIRKPNAHFVMARRVNGRGVRPNEWRLAVYPIPKQQDKSGYRLLETLASVNGEASTAVRLATSNHQARLPFAALTNRIDGAEDVVVIGFATAYHGHHWREPFCYFHPVNQIISALRFDQDYSYVQFYYIQKVAFTYNNSLWHMGAEIFRCSQPHMNHESWKICPEELFGFLNLFRNLKEVYIILPPGRDSYNKELARTYTKNFFTLTSDERRRRSLDIFYDSERSFIEVSRDLMFIPIPSTSDTTPTPEPARFTLEHYNDMAKMLGELKQEFLSSLDGSVHRYLLSLEARKNLVMKVFLQTGGEDRGYGPGEEHLARGFREGLARTSGRE